MRKRITSLFLVLALCLTLLPTTALAEEAGAAQETQDSTEVGDGYTIEEDTAVQGKGENDKAVQTVQALIDALPAAEDISDANADEVSGQLDAIDEAKLALTEEQATQLDFAKYDAAAAAVLALAGEPDANEPAVLADTTGTQPSGSGTAKDPYQITSAAELIWLRDAVNAGEVNTCAELQQDVTHVDETWISIGTSKHPYTGTFNGNGHTIRVLLDGWGQALFGYVGAVAKLTDIAVTKRQSENYSLNASAPLARSNAGTITRCRYSGGMTAKGSLGGLVYTNSGTIEACYVYAGQLNGGSRIEMYNGGLAGGIAYENTGTIVNSYFYGDIVQAQSNGTVRDIIGWGAIAHEKSGGKIINCYYGADSDDGYGGKTEDQFRDGEVTYLLNGGTARDDWRQNRYAGDDTPVLDRSHAQVRKSGDYYVSLYPHVHCICGGGTTSGGHSQHSGVTYTAWTNDEAASQYGDSSHTAANSLPKDPGKYYLTSDVTLRDTGTWRPADGTVLCLNGQTVREFAFYKPAYDVITVDSGVTFSLTECASIQGDIHCASSAATHTVNNSGTFNFYNGRLRDTKSKADGAAVYNTGTFNMYGGTINDNNTTALGGGVYNAGACNLYGGTITNNGTGGGVYNNGTLTVGGTLTAAGNTSGRNTYGLYNRDGGTVTINGTFTASGGEYAVYNFGPLNLAGTVNANKNVYLGTGRTITVVGELADASSITVQTKDTPAAGSPVTIATTENADWIKEGSFVSWTPGKYAVSRINEGKTVVLRGHEHDWSYTLGSDGTAISAECGNADGLCGNTNGGSITIAPPSGELIYDGSAKAAKLTTTGWTAADVGEIVYQKDGSALSAVPVDAGTYTASITLGEGNKAATASVKYTIQRADPKASDFTFAAPSPLTYDGNAKTATVEPNTGINGMGAVTVKYFKNGAETEPKDAGDYTVKVSVAEGANYNATTDDLTTDDWKFTIGKATQTIIVPTDKTIVKDGIAENISNWATVAGVTGGSNPGTLSYALEGSYTGVALEGNQLTVDSSVATGTTITIKVTAEETGNYNKEEQTFTVKVADKNTATVTITGLPDTVTYGQEFTLTASQTGDTTSANKKWTWDYDRECFKLVGPNANTETITLQAIKAGTPSKGITVTYESGTHKGSKTVTPGVAQKEVIVSGITASSKPYDGTPNATVNASGAIITGKETGDNLTVSVSAGSTFDSADVGSRTVTLGALTLGGASAGNYKLAASGNQTTATANITVRDLTVKPDSGQRKTFGDADPALTYAYSGEVSGETPVFDGALSREAGEDVGQYDITKGSLEPKDSGTFKAANYNLVLDTAVVTFEITKGTYGGSAPTKTVNILKNYAGVQTGTLTAADFFTTAPAEAKITAAHPDSTPINMMSLAGADASGNFTYASKTNITAASDESWTVTISSKNYTDITTAELIFKPVDKIDVNAQITFPNGTLTYNSAGQKYEKATISGVSGGTWNYTYVANSGTGASLDSAGLPKTAGTYTVTAKYEDDAHIGAKNATLTVSKATPTGAPTCTKITTSGKTLADAPLAIGTIAPAGGTLAWDMAANTIVAANTAYGWTYTPADTANYKALTGSLTPYAVSSGGGGGGGSAATPSVSDKAAKELKNAKEGSTVAIDMKGETKLPASVTKEIAGKDVTVELDMGGGMVWSFNGLDVPKGGVSLNLGVKTGTKTIPAKVINALTGEATTIQLQLNHNGPFGMSLKLSVDLGKKHDGLYANLYIYNPKSGELEFQSAGMISGGKASWVFDHASDYAIVIDKESHEPVTFPDVPDTAYYAEAVNWAVAKKITEGIGNKLFGSNDPCTRAQIVTFLWRAAGSPGPKTMSGFSDVPADSYYAKAVAWAVENGITGGTGDGKFSPDATCTRAQAVTFLYRASGMPAVSGNAAFSDVATNAYYAAAVKWAEKNGITGGIGGGLFGSDNNCTRAQIVTFLFRAYQGK